MYRLHKFSHIKLDDYTIRAPTRGSLLVGGVAVGGGGAGSFIPDEQYKRHPRICNKHFWNYDI